jgi:hypothetical protein
MDTSNSKMSGKYYGSNYKNNIRSTSTVNISSGRSYSLWEWCRDILLLHFVGILLYSNISGVIVNITNYIFTTGLNYDMNEVTISNFRIDFDKIGDKQNSTSPIVIGNDNSLTHAIFNNINMYNMKLPTNNLEFGIFTGSNAIIEFNSCFFNDIGGDYNSLFRRSFQLFLFYYVYFLFIYFFFFS